MADENYSCLSCGGCGLALPVRLNADGTQRKNQSPLCGALCRKKLKRREEGSFSERPCSHCNKPFRHAFKSTIYCTNACKSAAWQRANAEALRAIRRARAAEPTPEVLAERAGRAARRNLLSALKRLVDEKARSALHAARAGQRCEVCGDLCGYRGTKPRRFCSRACRNRGDKARSSMAASRKAQKARRRGVETEVFDPVEVLERDRWHCQICGVHTPRALRGTNEPDAPELDHIHPISKGGAHARWNTRCACRSCNAEKSDQTGEAATNDALLLRMSHRHNPPVAGYGVGEILQGPAQKHRVRPFVLTLAHKTP